MHIHSIESAHKDGKKVANNTIENIPVLVFKPKENGIDMCAITDHDRFGYSMYQAIKSHEGNELQKVLPGVEFSVNFDGKKVIHIVTIFDDSNAYDKTDMLIASGGTAGYVAISKKKESKYELEYIQAWLAHPYTEKIFQIQGSDFEGGFTARGTFLLNKIPFVDLDFNNADHKKLYGDVVSKTRRI